MREFRTYQPLANRQFDRFILFAYHTYYPTGGFEDAIATSNDISEITSWIDKQENDRGFDYNYWHIFDATELRVVNIQGKEVQLEGVWNEFI